MKNNPLISIIVPIYKVEKYLEKCVHTITSQTYKNLEIILVDDGSPDNCPVLCEALAKTDKRIKVIHKTNGGLSDARNVGFEHSSGDFIAFIDSDDFININYIETLYNNLIKTNADMSICNYQDVYEDQEIDITEKSNSEVLVFDSTNKFEQLFGTHRVNFITAWGKLYKREIFDKIKYPIHKIHEDEFVCHHILSLCNKVCFSDVKYYYYLQRQNSIMHQKKHANKNLDAFEALYDRFLFFKDNYPKLALNSLYAYLSDITVNYYKFDKSVRKELLDRFYKALEENKKELKQLSTKHKFKLFLFKYFRVFYKFYYK